MKSDVVGPVYWSVLEHGGWKLHLAATSSGLCYVGSANKPFEEMEEWLGKQMRPAKLIRNDEALSPYIGELMDYIDGKLIRFTIPCDMVGTPFQRSVWEALRSIPYGETRSYSDIAESIGKPAAVRAVGSAIGANPVLMSVPCHRVIGKNGALTGFRGGLEMKSRLLSIEKEVSASRLHEAACHE